MIIKVQDKNEDKDKAVKHEEKKNKKGNKELEELKAQVSELTDKCVRAQAEVINFKKRKEEETSLRLKYCNEELLLKFVGVCDNFERAIKMDDEDLTDEVSKFLEGFKMMYTNMLEPHSVVEVLQKGYMYKDKILRPAMVKIND